MSPYFALRSVFTGGLVLSYLSPILIVPRWPTRDTTSPVASSLLRRSISDLSACNTRLEFYGKINWNISMEYHTWFCLCGDMRSDLYMIINPELQTDDIITGFYLKSRQPYKSNKTILMTCPMIFWTVPQGSIKPWWNISIMQSS